MLFSQRHATFFMLLFFFFFFFTVSLLHRSCNAKPHYTFVVKEAPYTRLCSTKNILTVNGQFPGPTLKVHKGDTVYVNVVNKGKYNITLHWHGVEQPRNPWSDGPVYITQCSIQPGARFLYKVIFSIEEGTLWWHAHSDWSRATVHGAIIVYPKIGRSYPFPKPHAEVPIILGEWWKEDVMKVLELFEATGGPPNVSDALTINGQPGLLYPCSRKDTFKLNVDPGKRYSLRILNAAMNTLLFFAISNHNLTVVGIDSHYTKPFTTSYITISPGQTLDAILLADQNPNMTYYMAARAFSTGVNVTFVNTTTTGIVQYKGSSINATETTPFSLPYLPFYNDTNSAFSFFLSLKSLNDKKHPANVPKNITTRIFSTLSLNIFPCEVNNTCEGPNGTRLAGSMNNITFDQPNIDILRAYYNRISGIFGTNFPDSPPLIFNFTRDNLPLELEIPRRGTEVKVLEYNSEVEVILQGTNLVAGIDHPMHLHGFSFYIVGMGFGNFDNASDPLSYNLVDPPFRNTVTVPKNGWVALRFKANNPGVWFMHCHIDRHQTWGMETVFIVKNGKRHKERLLPPPPHMPPC